MTAATFDDADFRPREDRAGLRWGVSFIAMLVLHAGVGFGLMELSAVAEIEQPPPGAVMIDLTPLEPAPEPAPAPQPVEEMQPAPQPEPEPIPEPEPPPPPPIPEPIVEPPPPVVPEPEVVLPEKPPEPPPPEPVKPEPVKIEPVKPPPKPKPKVQQPKPRPVPANPAPTAVATESAAPVAAPPAPPSPARVRTWQTELLSHLERHKRYPRQSQARGEQGTAYVRFVINRQGDVLSARLERGSGFGALDEETVALVQRASPLPAPPEGETRNAIELVVPVRYGLR